MNPLFKNIKEELAKGIKNVSEKTNELTRLGRLKIDILALTRDKDKIFLSIGEKVYKNSKTSSIIELESDRQISSLLKKVKEIEKKIRNINKKIETLRKEDGIEID